MHIFKNVHLNMELPFGVQDSFIRSKTPAFPIAQMLTTPASATEISNECKCFFNPSLLITVCLLLLIERYFDRINSNQL